MYVLFSVLSSLSLSFSFFRKDGVNVLARGMNQAATCCKVPGAYGYGGLVWLVMMMILTVAAECRLNTKPNLSGTIINEKENGLSPAS